MGVISKTAFGFRWRRTINWGWIKMRWTRRHCRHVWVPGETKKNPRYVCNQSSCGVWRWNPFTWRICGEALEKVEKW